MELIASQICIPASRLTRKMTTFTIGFTGKNAGDFFKLLLDAKVARLLDVRLNNTSQLAGFAKKDDLRYFLRAIGGIDYQEVKELAPSKLILSSYQKGGMPWEKYEDLYLNEISRRSVERLIEPKLFEQACLLCSEHEPHLCHRRLAVEYLNEKWNSQLDIKHLY